MFACGLGNTIHRGQFNTNLWVENNIFGQMQRREPFGFEVVSEDPAINYRLGLQPTKRSRPPEGVEKEELGRGEIHDTHRAPRPRWTVDRQFPTISNISRRRRAVVG